MEDLVTELLIERIDGGALSRLLAGGKEQQLAEVRAELAEISDKLRRLGEDMATRKMSYEMAQAAGEGLERRRTELKADLDSIVGDTTLAEIPIPLDRKMFEARPFDWRRQVIQAIIDKVIVKPQSPRKGRAQGFDPKRIEIIWKV